MLRPRDMKVGVRLAGLSAVGIVLVTVIGFSAVNKLSAVDKSASNLYKHELLATDALGRLHDAEGDSRVDLHMYLEATTAKDRADVRADVQEVDGNVDQAVKDFLAADTVPSHQALMAEFQSAFGSWQRLRDNTVFPAVDRGDVATAQKTVNGPITALDDKFAEPVDQLVELEAKAAQARVMSARSTFTGARTMILLLVLGGIAIAIALSVVITRSITGPLRKTVTVLGDVANRKLTGEVDVSSKDEIGQIAASLNSAMSSLRETLATIDDNVQTLAGASEELSAVSNQMAGSAEETSTQSGAASAAGEQVSASVGTVAAAVEEFSASITEISKNATDAAQVARDAAEMAQIVNDNIGRLDQSSAEIGNVVGVITSIAEQTNLLALNATIEAARAGDAGKGFAVVANEVKELASSTTRATEDISTRITAIQADTHQAITSVGEIMGIIERINSLQSAIAAAVEEQSVTTNEIGRNITEAATGTSEIARNISVVANAAQEAAHGASQTQTSAGELATMSETLRELVGQFEL